MQAYIGLLAGVLSLVAYGIYIYKIWLGNTRPSRSSWWILTVVWVVVLFSSVSVGTEGEFGYWTSYVQRGIQVAYIFGSFGVAISTLWRGSPDTWGIWDWLCAIFAGIALILFAVLGSEYHFISLILAIFADFFGIAPTIRNAYRYPQHEDFIAWMLECIASFIALFAVSIWAFTVKSAGEFFPILYLVIVNVIITYFIWIDRRVSK